MKYRKFIEDKFLVDKAESGKLVPFKFNMVQNKYYDDLCKNYKIEENGISVPIRDNIVKARREGFSSLILALFAADDILQDNPTETSVLSYKDDATKTFRRRYRTYILSYFAEKMGIPREQLSENINLLEGVAKEFLAVDSNGEFVMQHNRAHFYCGTASAKVGGRGGVLHKGLFSEIAFYPDTEKISAAEMIEATLRQIDTKSGWAFAESTDGGIGTYQHKLWNESKLGRNRFRRIFYGWKEFYSQEEYDVVKSEYVDKDALRRDYPETEEDLFKGSAKSFLVEDDLLGLVNDKKPKKELIFWLPLQGTNYIDQAEILQDTLLSLVKANPNRALYVGIDVAKSIDATVMTVLRGREYDITGGVKIVAIDSTGVGDFLPDWFERNSRWQLLKVKFSRQSKDVMYKNMQVVLADHLTSLPELKTQDGEFVSDEHKDFYNQWLALEKETIGNLLVVHHPTDNQKHDEYSDGAHDDYPDSWTLAEHGYVFLHGVPVREKKPQDMTVQNAVEVLLKKPMSDRKKYASGGTSFE